MREDPPADIIDELQRLREDHKQLQTLLLVVVGFLLLIVASSTFIAHYRLSDLRSKQIRLEYEATTINRKQIARNEKNLAVCEAILDNSKETKP